LKFLLRLLLPILCWGLSIERDTLDNGMVVLTVQAHRIPVVEMKALVRAGSVYDPAGKEGLANVVSNMLLRGTQTRSAYEVVESIESVGGALAPFANTDYAGLNGKVLNKDLVLLIDLLNDCLRNPMFDEVEFARLKGEVVSGIRAESDDPFEYCKREFRRLIFGTHPLAHYPEGHDSSVLELRAADARQFHDSYYVPGNIFLVFVGDFEKDTLLKVLRGRFGDWQKSETDIAEIVEPKARTKPVGRIVPMDISQSYIVLGNLGPKYGADDWLPTRVMNYILGTSSVSRIYTEVRAERGLAYVAYSHFDRFMHGGYFAAEAQTKKERTSEAVQTILEVLYHTQDTIYTEELERAKQFYTGYFPLTYDSYSEMANLVAHIELENLGLDYIEKFNDSIRQLTLDDLRTAARRYLHPESYHLLILGDIKPEDVAVEGIEWVD
jgi:zinc protease